jgi:hypothetical protein
VLPALWQRARAAEDPRVQEKAWAALVEIVARSGNLELVQEWDRTLAEAKQSVRRLHLLTEVSARWPRREDARSERALAAAGTAGSGADRPGQVGGGVSLCANCSAERRTTTIERRLHWLLTVGEMAFRDGRRAAPRAAQEAQAFLARHKILGAEFERLARQARQTGDK